MAKERRGAVFCSDLEKKVERCHKQHSLLEGWEEEEEEEEEGGDSSMWKESIHC